MSDIDKFYDVIRRFNGDVRSDPLGHLSLSARRELWAALELQQEASAAAPFSSKGHELRARLALRVADRSLHAWETEFPDAPQPHELLADIREFFGGRLTASDLAQSRDSVWRDLLDDYSSPLAAAAGGHAACASAATALGDERRDGLDEADDATDPELRDAGFWGSVAASSALPWRGGDASARRMFWLWYLDEAARCVRDFVPPKDEAAVNPDEYLTGFGPGPDFRPFVRRVSGAREKVVDVLRTRLSSSILEAEVEVRGLTLPEAHRLVRALVLSELLEGEFDDSADRLILSDSRTGMSCERRL